MTPMGTLYELLGLGEPLLLIVRIIGGVGGSFVGWFVTDPLARISYRLARHKPIPDWTLPWLKLGGAAILGLVVFFLIQLGGSGYGPGPGGGPGKGPGKGGTEHAGGGKDGD